VCGLSSQMAMSAPAHVKYSEGDFSVHLAGVYDDPITGRRDKLRLLWHFLELAGSWCAYDPSDTSRVPATWYPQTPSSSGSSSSGSIQQKSCREEFRGKSWEQLKDSVQQWKHEPLDPGQG